MAKCIWYSASMSTSTETFVAGCTRHQCQVGIDIRPSTQREFQAGRVLAPLNSASFRSGSRRMLGCVGPNSRRINSKPRDKGLTRSEERASQAVACVLPCSAGICDVSFGTDATTTVPVTVAATAATTL